MTDSNQKLEKCFLEKLDAQIISEFTHKSYTPMANFTFMNPKETVAELAFNMNDGKTERDMPIMEGRNKKLLGIISLVDLVRFLPPGDKLPKKYFFDKNKQERLKALEKEVIAFIDKKGAITIEKAFEEQLDSFSERFQVQNSAVRIRDKSFLKDLFQKLIDATGGEIKYRTLPIVKHDQKNSGCFTINRMWSYIDALSLIIEMKDQGTASLLTENVDTKVCTKNVYTLKQDDTLSQALLNLQQLPFYPTHLPVTGAGGFTAGRTAIKGMVDEVLINTLQHDIFRQDLAAMPIHYIASSIKQQETVKLDTTIGNSIEKWIQRYTKPTAILVGDYNQTTNEFEMDGIVNYVDLFNRVLELSKES
jgi:CBS domain